jgi:putative glycosyltransferase (TIGR04348 family)
MHLLIVTPAPRGSTSGNRITARRWATLLRRLGHSVVVRQQLPDAGQLGEFDCLVALHARRSAEAVRLFRQFCPGKPILVCLTGTDLHQDLAAAGTAEFATASQSLEWADRIVLLEPVAIRHLSESFRQKALVIFQSARRLVRPPPRSTAHFVVTVVGHLRQVKDPFRTEAASRLLPTDSRIQVVHLGAAMEAGYAVEARRLAVANRRYRWLGELRHADALRQLAASHLTVSSSITEGAPIAISEAIVNDVPILASRIDATRGMLGDDYPGFFETGQTRQLADLMYRAETNARFNLQLQDAIGGLKSRFCPSAEMESLRQLLAGIASPQ